MNVYTASVNKGYYLNWIPVENKHQVYSQLYLVFTWNNQVYTAVFYPQNLKVAISSLTQSIQGFVMYINKTIHKHDNTTKQQYNITLMTL